MILSGDEKSLATFPLIDGKTQKGRRTEKKSFLYKTSHKVECFFLQLNFFSWQFNFINK